MTKFQVHDFPVALNVSAGAPEPNNTAYISEPETSVLVEKPIEFSIGLFVCKHRC